jgi:UDP-glucose 4-epimerase
MELNLKKILIIGGLGFIGKNLYLKLKKIGYTVHIFSDIPAEKDDIFNNYLDPRDLIIGDIRDIKSLNRIVKDYFAIFSFAGLSGAASSLERPILDAEINAKGQLNLLESCRINNPDVLIIFLSSRLVYGKPQYLPVNEEHPLNPDSFYAVHKINAEYYYMIYSKQYNIRSVVLRLSNPYGPFQKFGHHRYGILNWFLYLALTGQTINIYGDGRQKMDYFYISDLVELFLLLLENPEVYGKIYNVGYGQGISLYDAVMTVKNLIPDLNFRFTPWPEKDKKVETGDYISDISLIKNVCNWQPDTNLKSGLEKSIEFYKTIITQGQ